MAAEQAQYPKECAGILKHLEEGGHRPYLRDQTDWYVDGCPDHPNSMVRIWDGKRVDPKCLDPRPCERLALVKALGLEGHLRALALLDKYRSALVDSAGLDKIPEPEPLITGILQIDSLAWLQGKPGHGKSFVALDMAGSVATGNLWQGYRVRQGPVLYVAAEGVSGVRQRVREWEKSTGEPMAGVRFLPLAPQSTNGEEWSTFVALATELRPVLIVIDTQARVTVGGEENSARDMGEFVHQVERLRRSTGACVLIVHHEGRAGEHMRGSTALEGAATTIVRVVKDGDEVKISNPKQKDAPEFEDIRLRLVSGDYSAILCLSGSVRQTFVLTGQEEALVSGWREHFETDQVSPARLIEVLGFPKPSVYRALKKLVRMGVALEEGTSSRRLYRLK